MLKWEELIRHKPGDDEKRALMVLAYALAGRTARPVEEVYEEAVWTVERSKPRDG